MTKRHSPEDPNYNRKLTRECFDELIVGLADFIHIQSFASSDECSSIIRKIESHNAFIPYDTVPGLSRFGTSFSDAHKKNKHSVEYSKPDECMRLCSQFPAVQRLFGLFATVWPAGLMPLLFDNQTVHQLIVRRAIVPATRWHTDDLARNFPTHPQASSFTQQLGVNLYLEVPPSGGGGALFAKTKRMSAEELNMNRIPETIFVDEKFVGEPDWSIRPQIGDVVIFRNTELHAVEACVSTRITIGFHVGISNSTKPLVIWS